MQPSRRQFLAATAATAAGVGAGLYPHTALASPWSHNKAWWKTHWPNSTSPTHRRAWNVGVMSFLGAGAYDAYEASMGAQPEFVGGNCTGYGSQVWYCDTWEKLIGGPYEAGDAYVEPQTQPAIDVHPQTAHWYTSMPATVWGGLYVTTIPFGAPLSECEAAARGERNHLYRRFGARVRWMLERAGKRIDSVLLRPNWEGMNQDTGLRIRTEDPDLDDQFYLAGGTTGLYNEMMRQFAFSFWEGAQHRVPIALSPAMETSPGVPYVPYGDWMQAGVYDICCASFHPDGNRTATEELARTLVQGRPGWHTPRDAVDAALADRAAGNTRTTVAFLEHSAVHQGAGLGTPPRIDNYDLAYSLFADELDAHRDLVSFTGVLGTRMVNLGALAATDPSVSQAWDDMVLVHRERFGARR